MGGSSRRRCIKSPAGLSAAERAARPFPALDFWEELPAGERARLAVLSILDPAELLRLPYRVRKHFAAALLEKSPSGPETLLAWKLLGAGDG